MAFIVGQYNSATGASLEVFYSAEKDDILILVHSRQYGTDITPNGLGWNTVAYTETTSSAGNNQFWWKRVTTTGLDSVTATANVSKAGMNVYVVRGVDTVTAFDVTTVSRAALSENPLQSNQLTPVTDSTLILSILIADAGIEVLHESNTTPAADVYYAGFARHYASYSYADAGETTPKYKAHISTAGEGTTMTWVTFAFRDDGTNRKVGYVDAATLSNDIVLPAWSIGKSGVFTGSVSNVDLTATGTNSVPDIASYNTETPYVIDLGIGNGTDYRKVNCALSCASRSTPINLESQVLACVSLDDGMGTAYQPIGKNILIGDGVNFRRYKIDAKDTAASSTTLDLPILINPSFNSEKQEYGAVTPTVLQNITHFALGQQQVLYYAKAGIKYLTVLKTLTMKGGSSAIPCNMQNVVQAATVSGIRTIQNQSGMSVGQFVCVQSIKIAAECVWDSTAQSIEYPAAYDEGALRTQCQISPGDLAFSVDVGTGNKFILANQTINMGNYHWFKLISGTPAGGSNVISNAQVYLNSLDSGIENYTFSKCREITYTDLCDLSKGNTITDSVSVHAITVTNETDFKKLNNCSFSNNDRAIQITGDQVGTWTGIQNITFSNNTKKVKYTGNTNFSMSVDSKTNLTTLDVENVGVGTLTIVAPAKGIIFSGAAPGTQIIIYAAGTTTERYRINNATGLDTYTAGIEEIVDYTIMKVGYLPIRVVGHNVGPTQTTILLQQKVDRAYTTSSGLNYSVDSVADETSKLFTLSTASTLQNYYSHMLEMWIDNDTGANQHLRNVEFPIVPNGPDSYTLKNGWEFADNASIAFLSRDGMRYLDESDVEVATWAAVWSSGDVVGMMAEYQQVVGAAPIDAATVGVVDELVQVYGDAAHGSFDYTDHLIVKYQVNGYYQGAVDILSVYGVSAISDGLYIIAVEPTLIPGLTTGDPLLTEPPVVENHGVNPITWNGKTYSITITDSPTGNTGEDILRWINYTLSQDATLSGSDVFNWPDMVIKDGTKYATSYGEVIGSAGALLKGVRVVQSDGITAHAGFSKFQADDGTYFTPATQMSVINPNLLPGTRVQIFNTTQVTELYNDVLPGTGLNQSFTFGPGQEIEIGDSIRYRATYNSATTYKEPVTGISVATGGDITFLDSVITWSAVEAWNIDGATVAECSADLTNIDIDLSDSDGNSQKKRIVAWWAYYITTSEGIANFWDAYTVLSATEARQNVEVIDVVLENVGTTNIIFTDNDFRYYRSDYSIPYAVTSAKSIFMDYSGVPFVIETGVSGLTASESTQLFSVPVTTADPVKVEEIWTRLDLDPANPNVYADDASFISNDLVTLTRTDNGDGTSTVTKS